MKTKKDKSKDEKLKEAERLAEEFKDKYLRAHAALDNARKRLIKEKEEYARFANEDLLSQILYMYRQQAVMKIKRLHLHQHR